MKQKLEVFKLSGCWTSSDEVETRGLHIKRKVKFFIRMNTVYEPHNELFPVYHYTITQLIKVMSFEETSCVRCPTKIGPPAKNER